MTIEHDSDSTTSSNLPIDSFLSLISADSIEVILRELVEHTKDWLHVPYAAFWQLDLYHNGFRMLPANKLGKRGSPNNFISYQTVEELGLRSTEESVELSEHASRKLNGLISGGSLISRLNYYERTSGFLVVSPQHATASWADSDRD